jgi:SAM-dependent methyltransferase
MLELDERLERALETWDNGPYMTFLRPTVKALIEAAGIRPGMTVLDAGTGFGDPALEIAEVVGQTGRVVGIDHDDLSLEIARRRAEERGLSNVEFRRMEVTEIDLDTESFDAAVSRNVVVYFGDPIGFLEQLRRVTKPGGRVAAATWTAGDRNPLMGSAFQALRRHAPPEEPQPGQSGGDRVDTQKPELLAQVFERAGFIDTAHGTVALSLEGNEDVASEYWEQRRAGSPASQRVLERMTEEQRAVAEEDVVATTKRLIAQGGATGELGWASGRRRQP